MAASAQSRSSHAYRGKLQAAIFDWAGTTVDYGCFAPAVVFVDVFKEQGVEITIDEARGPMGLHKLEHIRQIAQLPDVARRWQEVRGKRCSDKDVQAMFDDFVPRELACIARYADLIPGTLETMATLRKRGLKIGSTTGYTAEVIDVLAWEAKKRGYEPDCLVCVSDVPAGRPAPWMCLQNAQRLGAYPMEAIVKIGDTVPDIAEGLNSGMWTIGVAVTGNEFGLTRQESRKLTPQGFQTRRDRVYERLYQAGAHFVVDGIGDVPGCLDEIESRLSRGEKP